MAEDKLPDDMILSEAADFWDEHSFLDFEDVEEARFSVDLRRNRNYVDINEELARKIRRIARQRGVSSRVLVNQWLKERVIADT